MSKRYVYNLADAVCGDHLIFYRPASSPNPVDWKIFEPEQPLRSGKFGDAVKAVEEHSRRCRNSQEYRIVKITAEVRPKDESVWKTEGGERIKGNL